MTLKKSLLAVATATTVAVAGTGVASAKDAGTPPAPAPTTQLSADGSLSNFNLGDQLGATFGSVDANGDFQLGAGIKALTAVVAAGTAVAGSITLLPKIDGAVKDFQKWASQYIPQA